MPLGGVEYRSGDWNISFWCAPPPTLFIPQKKEKESLFRPLESYPARSCEVRTSHSLMYFSMRSARQYVLRFEVLRLSGVSCYTPPSPFPVSGKGTRPLRGAREARAAQDDVGFGDVPEPLPESVSALYELVECFVARRDGWCEGQAKVWVRERLRGWHKPLVWVVRRDRRLHQRILELLEADDVIKKSKRLRPG